jgi:hypothetical protein
MFRERNFVEVRCIPEFSEMFIFSAFKVKLLPSMKRECQERTEKWVKKKSCERREEKSILDLATDKSSVKKGRGFKVVKINGLVKGCEILMF